MKVINNKRINNIPLIEVYEDNNEIKPLIFLFHGLTSNKESYLDELSDELILEGYYVVMIDSYLHGERKEEWFDKLPFNEQYKYIIDMEIETANNAKRLWNEYYKEQEKISSDLFYAFGSSMGGAVAYYLATIEEELKFVSTLVASPSLYNYYKDKSIEKSWEHDDVYQERMNKYKKVCPLINSNKLSNKHFFMGLGEKDTIVNPKYGLDLYHIIPEKIELKMYDAGHEHKPEMINDVINYFKNKKILK